MLAYSDGTKKRALNSQTVRAIENPQLSYSGLPSKATVSQLLPAGAQVLLPYNRAECTTLGIEDFPTGPEGHML